MSKTDFRVVCTDDGQHPSRELRLFAWQPGPGVWDATNEPIWDDMHPLASRNSGTRSVDSKNQGDRRFEGETTYVFECPSCKRNRPIKDSGLKVLWTKIRSIGKSELDISRT